MKNGAEQIDIVITWVDGSDPNWLIEKNKFLGIESSISQFTNGANRYQDQGLLKYWFRGIEKFMPWINKIYFVTYGHYPDWLNLENKKIKLVKHSDFMDAKYLPTFSSNPILLNLHRIPELSDKFIYFNDDMFVINPCKPTYFFKNGLPCDMAVLNPIVAPDLDPFWDMMLNNVMVINKNFEKQQVLKKYHRKWFTCKYGFKNLVRNYCLKPYKSFPGFYDNHLPNAFLKSTFKEVWEKNFDICDSTCMNKFRTENDITEWTMKYWQLAKGTFSPINKDKLGKFVSLKSDSAINYLRNNPVAPLVCLNDESENLEKIVEYFENKFPVKSKFEK